MGAESTRQEQASQLEAQQGVDEIKAEVAQRTQEAEALRAQLRQRGEQVTDLQQQLAAVQQERARLEAQQGVDEIKAEVAQRTQEAEALRAQLRQRGEQVTDLQQRLAAVQQEQARAVQAGEVLKRQLSARGERISALERDLMLAQEAWAATQQRVDEIKAEVAQQLELLREDKAEFKRQRAEAATQDLKGRDQRIARPQQEPLPEGDSLSVVLRWIKSNIPPADQVKFIRSALAQSANNQEGHGNTATFQELADAIQSDKTQRSIDLIVLMVVAIAVLVYGNTLLKGILEIKENPHSTLQNPLRPYSLQVLGLTFILPVLLIISVALRLPSEAITALLGAIIGYIFGSSRATDSSQEVKAVSPYPTVERAFAFVLDKGVPEADVLRAIRGADKVLVRDASVFDLYGGEGVPEGKKLLAVTVRLQAEDRSLTDAEIEQVAGRIVAAVQKTTGASLRS